MHRHRAVHLSAFAVVLCGIALSQLLPATAEAGVFIGLRADRVDLSRGEKPTLVIAFDQKLSSAEVLVIADEGKFEKTFSLSAVVPGLEHVLQWTQGDGVMGYTVRVSMSRGRGHAEVEETWIEVAATRPLTAAIPGDSVDLGARTFLLHTNHPPTHVEVAVLGDEQQLMGSSTVQVTAAKQGEPIQITWTEDKPGTVFRVIAKAHDQFGYWAEVEIIPWSLTIDHEDVNFETGSDVIGESELPKLDAPWSQITAAVRRVGQWVQCALYVAGYTDTVGDAASNRALSARRALSLARHFKQQGASFPIYYRGYGESVLAVSTPDGADESRNRRALYVVTAGTPPRGGSTPPGDWKRLR